MMAQNKDTDAYKAPFKLDRMIVFKHNSGRSENCVSNHTPNLISKVLWSSRQADKSVYLLSFRIACEELGLN